MLSLLRFLLGNLFSFFLFFLFFSFFLGGGGGGSELFTCPYPVKVQARPPRD